MKLTIKELRSIISEVVENSRLHEGPSSLPPQHPRFKSGDLSSIAERLAWELEANGFEIEKSKSLFDNNATFEANGFGRYFTVVVRKKTGVQIVSEDADFGVFNRNDPELAAFLKGVGNKNISKKNDVGISQARTVNKIGSMNSRSSVEDFDDEDPTSFGQDREKFRITPKIDYIIEFLDKTKNGSRYLRFAHSFATQQKNSPETDPAFKKFSNSIAGNIVKKFIDSLSQETQKKQNSITIH